MTQTGMSLGTPQYMTPEQAMGEREIDGRADIYALGCRHLRDARRRAAVHRSDRAGDRRAGDDRGAEIARSAADDPTGIDAAVLTAIQKPADHYASARPRFAAALANPAVSRPLQR